MSSGADHGEADDEEVRGGKDGLDRAGPGGAQEEARGAHLRAEEEVRVPHDVRPGGRLGQRRGKAHPRHHV